MKQKRVAAIHDISGFGKCSLTVALPIISAAGIETSVVPTAVLSTHTGGFEGYTYRDLTDDMYPFAKHWKSLDLNFDAIYTGFLGSYEQIAIVSDIFNLLKNDNTMIVVDPCMADNGELYKIYSPKMAKGMTKLCSSANLIVPNITEAAMMLQREYKEGPYTKEYIEDLLRELSNLGCDNVVLTGVYFDDDMLGAACYNKNTDEIGYAFNRRIKGYYHGTGDVFGSALVAALLNEFSLKRAIQIAVDFTYNSILKTSIAKTDIRFGVNFESNIPKFLKDLGIV